MLYGVPWLSPVPSNCTVTERIPNREQVLGKPLAQGLKCQASILLITARFLAGKDVQAAGVSTGHGTTPQ